MKYGIDLGTTNSAICKMEGGEPVIKKQMCRWIHCPLRSPLQEEKCFK